MERKLAVISERKYDDFTVIEVNEKEAEWNGFPIEGSPYKRRKYENHHILTRPHERLKFEYH